MIQFQRTFFFSNTTSSPSLRHFMFQFQLRSLHNPLISPHLPSLVNLTTNAVQHRNRFSFRSFGVTTNFNTVKSVTSVSGFSLPFRENGVGRSLRFSSTAPEKKSKLKKTVKAVAVRGKDNKDFSSSESVDKNVKNVEVEKNGLSEVSKSDKKDSKINGVKKTTTKKPPSKKKDVKISAATDSADSSKAVGEEVSKKSPSKGKKKKTNVKESSADSTLKETHDGSASTRSKKKDVNSSQVDLEKPLGNFTGKPLYPPTGKSVMVVESATKAKVIQRYLGDMYEVLPSYGHVRDLAARSGSVRPDDDFSMVWEVPSSAWTQLKSINLALSGAENLIIASDPDREGEAIAWHIIEMLHQQGALRDNVFLARVVFHEITEQSIKTALQAPREIDVNLVHAYLARRALDYLIGFNISPLLWRKLPGCQSAGRVQSAALSLICDREMDIDQFKPKEYWTMKAKFNGKERRSNKDVTFDARLTHFDSNKLTQFSITSDGEARDIEGKVNSAEFQVISMKKNKVRRNPPTPYITSTLQQDAGNKLNLSASQTMKIAQKLYEGVELSNGVAVGLITYMRTDGFHISDEAVANIRSLIIERYGQTFVAQSPPKYFKKVKNAQEAHEAIRPTDIRHLPSMLAGVLDEESLKLYTLIWSRTVSCQMEPAILEKIQVDIGNADKSIMLRSASSRVEFPGYQAVFTDIVTEAGQDRDSDGSNHDLAFEVLNSLKTEDLLHLVETEGSQHHTQPPPRYSEASLVKKLEELGIGRPSTYASTLRVLQDRKYVTVKSRVLSPEFRGRMVSAFLSHHFSEVTDYSFTADMETELDNVSAGLTKWKGLLGDYWTRFKSYCERTSNVHIHQVEKMLEKKFADYLFGSLPDNSRVCPSCTEGTLIFKVSRFGAGYFIGCDQHPRCKYIAKTLYGNDDDDDDDEEDTPKQNTMIEEPKLLGFNSANEKILLKSGPYGIYIQLGEDRKGHPPKRVSVPHVKDVDSITLEDALVLLQYPLTLGKHPQDGNPVELKVATRGYSIWHGSKIAPVPKRLIAFGTRHGRNYISGSSLSSSSSSQKKVFFSNFNLIPCQLSSCNSDSKDDFHIVMNILSNSAPSRGGHQIYSALDAALDDVTNLDKHFVLKVIETSCQTKLLHTPRVPPSDLIRYLKLVWKNNKDLITTSVVQSLVSSICCSTSPTQRPTKNDLLFLWDFLNHIARYHPPGLLNAPILNTLIQSLGGEGKAALDVFNKFQVFHCVPNHDTYYFTLQALLNTSTCSPDMIHQAASICQNMMLLLPPHDHHHGGSSHDQEYTQPSPPPPPPSPDDDDNDIDFQTALTFLGGIPRPYLKDRVCANLNLIDFNPLRQQLHHFVLKTIETSSQTKLIETRKVSPHNLIHFVKWAWRRRSNNNKDLITTHVLESLVSAVVRGNVHLRKNDILFLWDLLKHIGHCQTGLLNTQILNQLLYDNQLKFDHGKTALEIFHKFEVFQCVPSRDTYTLTLEALLATRLIMSHQAASICQKMLLHPETLLLDDAPVLIALISWFAQNNMTKEAYALYLAAKEKPKTNPNWPLWIDRSFLLLTITVLCSKKETVYLAFEMFNDIPELVEDRDLRFKNEMFRLVVRALCGFKEFDAVKQLILKIVVDTSQEHLLISAISTLIPALVNAGEIIQALEMLMLVESKGLYFCNHHMFRFWYSNDMLHIRKILEEAKKKDSKLTVALLYHALIVGYCKLHQFDRALKLLTEMKDFGVLYTNLDEYHKLIHSFCLMDMEWKLAIEQLEEMEPMDREMVEDELHTMATMDRQMVEERLEEMSEEQLEEVRISMQKYLS